MRFSQKLAGLFCVVLLAAGCGSAAASQPGSPTGTRVRSARSQVKLISFPPRAGLSDVDAVAAAGRSDALAMGETITRKNSFPLLDRWNGSAWHKADLPRPVAKLMGPESLRSAVTADASGSMWVFGQDAAVSSGTPGPTVWLRYQASHLAWGMLRTPGSSFISAAQAVGRDDVWVFGHPDGTKIYAWLFHDGKWQRTLLPGRAADVISTAVVTPGNIWALETYGIDGSRNTGGSLLHYSAGRWRRISLPAAFRLNDFSDVVACGPDCAWIGGEAANSDHGTSAAAARWNGSRWTIASPPVTATDHKREFQELLSDGRNGFWALAVDLRERNNAGPLWHYSMARWTRTSLSPPAELEQLQTSIPGSTSFWAIANRATAQSRYHEVFALISSLVKP
jgi:hypothetical protein